MEYLFALITNNVFPDIRQFFLLSNRFFHFVRIDNSLPQNVIDNLKEIQKNPQNKIDFIIPETQMHLLSTEEQNSMSKLYKEINNRSTVVELDCNS